MRLFFSAGILFVGIVANYVFASVSIPRAEYGVSITTFVGREGSAAGPEQFSAGPVAGSVGVSGGIFGNALTSSLGPVAPGMLVTLPGTTGVATSTSSMFLNFTPTQASTVIDIDLFNNQQVINMDGGGYVARGSGSFSIDINVRTTTTYTITGTMSLDSEDSFAYLQFVGQPLFLLANSNGPINISGSLSPGNYTFRGSTGSVAPEFNTNQGNSLDASSIDLTLTLNGVLVANDCDTIDFNNNQVFPEDQDVIEFFNVLAGSSCGSCQDIDFNNNGVFPEDQDVIDFFNVLAGGNCPA